MANTALLLAGIPSENPAFYHRVRFVVGDPAAWIKFQASAGDRTEFIVRDIEMDRARKKVHADRISCPADYQPSQGLSGDRATATAQAVAECLKRNAVTTVVTDRTLPFIFAWHIMQAGIALDYSAELGVIDRRTKDDSEIEYLAEAQRVTEEAILMACQTIARASAAKDGTLQHAGSQLTCERLQRMIAEFLLDREYQCPHGMIVATTPHSGDCHEKGSGPLKTGEAVIVDVYPLCSKSRYYGDCTRTVVHGQPSEMMLKMHAAVVAAKTAAEAAAVAGASADSVHAATKSQIVGHGFRFARGEISDEPVMPHGTGHGVGLEVHEPILLDDKGGTLMAREALTIEPGLYSPKYGGVRVEDLIIVAENGPPRNLNQLPYGLDWSNIG
jgi:Xaa-Pro aminopeptidase